MSVACYALVAFGWLVSLELDVVASITLLARVSSADDQEAWQFFTMIEASICPLGAQLAPFLSVHLGRGARVAMHSTSDM